MLRIRITSYLLLFTIFFLGGCGEETRKTLGLGKRQPDEFQVLRKAPLVVPPNFTLRFFVTKSVGNRFLSDLS